MLKLLIFVGLAVGEACNSLDEASCMGCIAGMLCSWKHGHCHGDTLSSNCTVMNMTDHHHDHDMNTTEWDLSEACHEGGNYPMYCTAHEAEHVSEMAGVGGHHMHGGLFMPNGAPGMTHDGSYVGDAPECQCWDLSGACQRNGNFPFYCTSAEADAVAESAGSSGSHEMMGLHMPNGYPDMIHDGSYVGDAAECDCLGTGESADETTSSSSSSSGKKTSKSKKAAVLAGVIVGLVILLVAIGACIFVATKRQKRTDAVAVPVDKKQVELGETKEPSDDQV